MKQILQQLAAYNRWANHRLTESILQMDEHLHQQHVPSSFPNLYANILHMWDVESIWRQRIHGHEKIMVPSQHFNPSMREAVNGLLNESSQWIEQINNMDEEALYLTVAYNSLKGEEFAQPMHELVLHLFNHQTYHRGQLVTIMRILGVTQVPATDLVVFQRQG